MSNKKAAQNKAKNKLIKPPTGANSKRISPIKRDLPKSFSFPTESFPQDLEKWKGGPEITKESDLFHVEGLLTHFRDIARPNIFKVKITPPSILKTDWNNTFVVLAKSASFPSIEVQNYEFERAGTILHIPTNKMIYGDLSVTFYADVDFNIRSLFNRWQRLALYNWQEDIGCVPLMALQGFVTVYQYDSYHNPVYGIEVDNAWPRVISDIALDNDSTDQFETFNVTFAFSNHEVLKSFKVDI